MSKFEKINLTLLLTLILTCFFGLLTVQFDLARVILKILMAVEITALFVVAIVYIWEVGK